MYLGNVQQNGPIPKEKAQFLLENRAPLMEYGLNDFYLHNF